MSLVACHIDDLIALCRSKDQRAQFEVYNRYSKAMYNVALRIVKDEHYAEDVMQEGFLRAFTKIADYRSEVAFGAWLKRIIVNHSIDFYKRNNRLVQQDLERTLYKLEDESGTDGDSDGFVHFQAAQVLQTMQDLKDSYRMVLTLFFIEGYDHEEITEILNINYGNCRTLLSRAKESLRNKLQQKGIHNERDHE